MTEAQLAPNLQPLEDQYEILGELRIGDRSRMYVGRRRSDGEDVVVSAVRAPTGDENNALNHYAADTQLLSTLDHPQIPRVLEGRWLGKDELAVVSERRPGNTLGEVLARGERFSPPRVANILGEVTAVLEWARNNGVVHRGVTLDTLAFDPATNQAIVSLMPTPIAIQGIPDAGDDARTIGMLAWAMLTGEPRTSEQPLVELRPDLAKRVLDETEAMVRSSHGAPHDVPTFLSVVAAADALRAGEMEIAELEAQIMEERRGELAAFEAEQRASAEKNTALEAQLASERKEFERRMAEEEAELAAMRDEIAALKAHEESQILVERTQLAQERNDCESRVADLDAREAEIDRRLAEVARLRAEEGERIDAAIASAVETVATTTAAAPPRRADTDDGAAWKGDDDAAARPWVGDMVRKYSVGQGEPVASAAVAAVPVSRPRWLIPSLIGGSALAIAAIVIGIGYSQRHGHDGNVVSVGKSPVVATPPTAPTAVVHAVPRGGVLSQSAAGTVGAAPVGAPLSPSGVASVATPAAGRPTIDSGSFGGAVVGASSSTAQTVTLPASAPLAQPVGAPGAQPAPARRPADLARPRGVFSAEEEAIARADSIRRDSLNRRRRDSTGVRRDTTGVRPDTLR